MYDALCTAPCPVQVDIPVDPYLAQDLTRHGVELGMLPRSHWAFLRGVAVVAPSIGILCLIAALQGRMQELMNERMYDLLHRDRFQLILVRAHTPHSVPRGM